MARVSNLWLEKNRSDAGKLVAIPGQSGLGGGLGIRISWVGGRVGRVLVGLRAWVLGGVCGGGWVESGDRGCSAVGLWILCRLCVLCVSKRHMRVECKDAHHVGRVEFAQ